MEMVRKRRSVWNVKNSISIDEDKRILDVISRSNWTDFLPATNGEGSPHRFGVTSLRGGREDQRSPPIQIRDCDYVKVVLPTT
ncbi:hypothetical protein HS1genome_1262 [Sulfodiicoccus acidiphilus]|uniref:Uncharacterized protein n=1 Tax=Sulfodiicoccus acidiphilus TaxID=1670455 RepID=A0A348B3X1_9CREN|nr:hypothetical protein HS1genome_1262 [Sulfodiicoccus acidiphilus]GGT88332.1 hypothetical protein GCM10007116_02900 [Sulfodiicoccus acidiphilus]